MNINQAINARIAQLCEEQHRSPAPLFSLSDGDITMEAVDAVCAELQITVADFFSSDLFRNLDHN